MADKPTTAPPDATPTPKSLTSAQTTPTAGAKSESDKKNPPKKKAVGPIRWSALVPVATVCVGCFLYFSLLFDLHLRYMIETIGYHVFGAEVNVQKLKTSFRKAHFHLEGLQTTDPDHPAKNLFEIGQIRFGMSWDALLRGKILVEEAIVDGIQVGSPRKKTGKVKPPPPPPTLPPEEKSKEPSQLTKEGEKLKAEALQKTQDKYSDNVLGDLAALSAGGSRDEQMAKLENTLESKKKINELKVAVDEKQKLWSTRLAGLPQAKDFTALNENFKKIKTSGFNSPAELQNSLQALQTLSKDAETKLQSISTASKDLQTDLQKLSGDFKSLEPLIKSDIESLKSHFKMPTIDGKELVLSLTRKYTDPWVAKFKHYQSLIQPYIPPKMLSGSDKKTAEISIQPKPRARGTDYEFGRPHSYPGLWIKLIRIGSKSSNSPYSGDAVGSITDITTNQVLIDKPTKIQFQGNFPSAGLMGLNFDMVGDFRQDSPKETFSLKIAEIAYDQKPLITSDKGKVVLPAGKSRFEGTGNIVSTNIDIQATTLFSNTNFQIESPDTLVKKILDSALGNIHGFDLRFLATGNLGSPRIDLVSNIGTQIEEGIKKAISAEVDRLQSEAKAFIENKILAEKKKLEDAYNQLQNQVTAQIKELEKKSNDLKSDVEKKITESKGSLEKGLNSAKAELEAKAKLEQQKKQAELDAAKKQAEAEAKAKAEAEVKKAADELKRKFGL